MRLDKLPQGRPAYVDRIDWTRMTPSEGQRLREFGVCEGASIELLHRGGIFGRGAIAARVGRMTIAMRAGHASAIEVATSAATPVTVSPVPVSPSASVVQPTPVAQAAQERALNP